MEVILIFVLFPWKINFVLRVMCHIINIFVFEYICKWATFYVSLRFDFQSCRFYRSWAINSFDCVLLVWKMIIILLTYFPPYKEKILEIFAFHKINLQWMFERLYNDFIIFFQIKHTHCTYYDWRYIIISIWKIVTQWLIFWTICVR